MKTTNLNCFLVPQLLMFWVLLGMSEKSSHFSYGDKIETEICAFEFLTFRPELPAKTYLEVFCQIPTNNLKVENYIGSFQLSIVVFNSSGVKVEEETLIDSVKVQPHDETSINSPPKLIRSAFLIESGEYEARIRVTDLKSSKFITFTKKLYVADYSTSALSLSDLQIATSIMPTREKNILVKNNRMIVPNIPRIVGLNSNELYVYAEIYNLQYSTVKQNEAFIATYIIRNKKGDEVKSERFRYQKPGEASFITAGFDVDDLESGQYQLILKVEDLDSTHKIQKSTHFLVIKSSTDLQLEKAFSDLSNFHLLR
ncbi:MAG: hypothetical protein ACE5IR_24465 [bacterium]